MITLVKKGMEPQVMSKVISKDGTPIGYERIGEGQPVILVDGAFCYRGFGPMPKLAALLAPHFSVVTYDRRGRGESGDTQPYAVQREIEDIGALVDAVGGSASLVGLSSGAVLALRAAASGLAIPKLALYEPPLVIREAPAPRPPDNTAAIRALVAADRRGDAVKLFMRTVGVPAFMMPLMRIMPGGVWSKLTAVAHTLPYDFAQLGDTGADKSLPPELARAMGSVTAETLAMFGGKSPAYMQYAARTVAGGIKGARVRTIEGQTHNVAPKAIAPVLIEFLQGTPAATSGQVLART